jgi:hypothetical protein
MLTKYIFTQLTLPKISRNDVSGEARNGGMRVAYRILTLSDPTSELVRQYKFSVLFRCQKMSDKVFVAFVRSLSEPVRRFSSCSTDFS